MEKGELLLLKLGAASFFIIGCLIIYGALILNDEVDGCLDQGGRWDYVQEQCDYGDSVQD